MQGDSRSHGLWEQSAPPAPATSSLADSIDTDVAVIGAGYTGLSAALHLRGLGVDVVVLEGSGLRAPYASMGCAQNQSRMRMPRDGFEDLVRLFYSETGIPFQ
jgi:glycine/D-amino acid oxidase-like deaminating enzyme